MSKANVTKIALACLFMVPSIATADWIYYDDGTPRQHWVWANPNHDCGWGIRVIAPADGWVDSISTFFSEKTNPGGDSAMFRIYGALPNNMPDSSDIRMELPNVHIERWTWNKFPLDTTLTHMEANEMFFSFYLQLGDQYHTHYFTTDLYWNSPAMMLQLIYGVFRMSDIAGDHLQRVHFVTSSNGVGEWMEEKPVRSGLEGLAGRIRAVPNPFTCFAKVPGHEAEPFALYDISGKFVGTYKGDRIGVGLSPGIYFLRSPDNKDKPLRIVKVR